MSVLETHEQVASYLNAQRTMGRITSWHLIDPDGDEPVSYRINMPSHTSTFVARAEVEAWVSGYLHGLDNARRVHCPVSEPPAPPLAAGTRVVVGGLTEVGARYGVVKHVNEHSGIVTIEGPDGGTMIADPSELTRIPDTPTYAVGDRVTVQPGAVFRYDSTPPVLRADDMLPAGPVVGEVERVWPDGDMRVDVDGVPAVVAPWCVEPYEEPVEGENRTPAVLSIPGLCEVTVKDGEALTEVIAAAGTALRQIGEAIAAAIREGQK